MHHRYPSVRRLSLALLLGLGMASLSAVATTPETTETTNIQVITNGKTENVVLHNLKIGESRQLYSEGGTLVSAVRTADAIELDIDGEKTRIGMHDGPLTPDQIAALVVEAEHTDGASPRVIRVQRRGGGDAQVDAKRVVLVSTADGSLQTIDGDAAGDIELLLKDAGVSTDGGKRIIVKRHVTRDASADK